VSVSNIHGHGVSAHGPRTVNTQAKRGSEKSKAAARGGAAGGSSFEQELSSVGSGDGHGGAERRQGNPQAQTQKDGRKLDLSA